MEDLVRELFTSFPLLSTVLAGGLAFHGFASFVVNLTNTPKDDGVVRRVYTVLEWAAGVVSAKAKQP